jgi:hypothetical protein
VKSGGTYECDYDTPVIKNITYRIQHLENKRTGRVLPERIYKHCVYKKQMNKIDKNDSSGKPEHRIFCEKINLLSLENKAIIQNTKSNHTKTNCIEEKRV